MSPYISRIEGSPPKRNAAGSIPVGDAIYMINRAFFDFCKFENFVGFTNIKEKLYPFYRQSAFTLIVFLVGINDRIPLSLSLL